MQPLKNNVQIAPYLRRFDSWGIQDLSTISRGCVSRLRGDWGYLLVELVWRWRSASVMHQVHP